MFNIILLKMIGKVRNVFNVSKIIIKDEKFWNLQGKKFFIRENQRVGILYFWIGKFGCRFQEKLRELFFK